MSDKKEGKEGPYTLTLSVDLSQPDGTPPRMIWDVDDLYGRQRLGEVVVAASLNGIVGGLFFGIGSAISRRKVDMKSMRDVGMVSFFKTKP